MSRVGAAHNGSSTNECRVTSQRTVRAPDSSLWGGALVVRFAIRLLSERESGETRRTL